MNDALMHDREAWLNAAALHIRDLIFRPAGLPEFEHPYRIACGFPKGSRTIAGICCKREMSADGRNEIWVTPRKDDPVDVLSVLIHEMVHALDDCQHGHRGPFAVWARAIGLEGPLPSTEPGTELRDELKCIADACGSYPHARLATPDKKPGSRQKKCECRDCAAVWRMAETWRVKVTCCPCCRSRNITRDADARQEPAEPPTLPSISTNAGPLPEPSVIESAPPDPRQADARPLRQLRTDVKTKLLSLHGGTVKRCGACFERFDHVDRGRPPERCPGCVADKRETLVSTLSDAELERVDALLPFAVSASSDERKRLNDELVLLLGRTLR